MVYVVEYRNSTGSGYVDLDPARGNRHDFETRSGTRWNVKMRTQTLDEEGTKGLASDWSEAASAVSQGLPGAVFMEVSPHGPREAQVTWDLPAEDADWSYGVDIEYQLKQRGVCEEPVNAPPVTKYDVQDRRTILSVCPPFALIRGPEFS